MTEEEILAEFSKHWPTISPNDEGMVRAIVTRSVEEAKRYIKRAYEDNVPAPENILEDYNLNFKRADEATVSLSSFYLLRTVKEVIRNPEILFDIYREERASENFWEPVSVSTYKYKYTADRDGNYKKVAHDVFHNFWDTEKKKLEKEKILNLTDAEKVKLADHFKFLLNDAYKNMGRKLTSNYIKGIVQSVSSLYELGVLGSLVDKNNQDRRIMGLDVLKFDLEEEPGSDQYAVVNLMDEEFLKKLPFEKLALMHAFYSNRLKKVSNTLGMGMFICNKLDMLDGSTKEIDMEVATNAYYEYMSINSLFTSIVPIIYDDMDEYREDGVYDGKRYVGANSRKIYDNLVSPFKNVYLANSKNKGDLEEDFFVYLCTQVTDYWQKDFSLETLLLIAMENFQTINWGYIPEENLRGRNSIVRKRENILLGFDVAGFNMPVRLHMPIDKVRAFWGNFDKTYEIPNYVGNDDMNVWDKNMGASILMPLSPQHRKRLIATAKKMNKDSYYYKFIRHLEGMQYDNNLFRIQKWKDPNGRKGVRSYTNLLTGDTVTPQNQRD